MGARYLLTDRVCQRARHNPKHKSATLLPDGGSLYLRIRENQGKAWVWRYREDKKRGGRIREIGLGPYPEVGLKEARDKADEARQQHKGGIDVLGAKKDEKVRERGLPTFKEAVAEFIEWKTKLPGKGKLEGSSLVEWETTLRLHVTKLHPMRVDVIEPEDVRDALKPIWATNRSARRILNRVEQIFARCIALRQCKLNPASWDIQQHLLGHGSAAGESHRSLPWQEIPAFMERLRAETGPLARSLEFVILTAARSGDVVGDRQRGRTKPPMSAAEIEGDLWSVPGWSEGGRRMKSGAEHRVPLSDRARAIVGEVFGVRKGGNTTLFLPILKKLDVYVTVHGFRSSFKSWALENGYGHDKPLIEFALAHKLPDKVDAAYTRTTRLEERRVLMQKWSDFCAGIETGARVLPLRRA